jgi:hypothetical protein
VLLLLSLAITPALLIRPYDPEAAPIQKSDDKLVVSLARATLWEAGYIETQIHGDPEEKTEGSDSETADDMGASRTLDDVVDDSHPDRACIEKASENSDLRTIDLTQAIVAAENYNRPKQLRFIEWMYADAVQWFTGHLPDMSLGKAQLRPSTVRRVLADKYRIPNPSDMAVADVLSDDCLSLTFAALLISDLLKQSGSDGPGNVLRDHDEIKRVAAAYSGSGNGVQAGFDYTDVVLRSYWILHGISPYKADYGNKEARYDPEYLTRLLHAPDEWAVLSCLTLQTSPPTRDDEEMDTVPLLDLVAAALPAEAADATPTTERNEEVARRVIAEAGPRLNLLLAAHPRQEGALDQLMWTNRGRTLQNKLGGGASTQAEIRPTASDRDERAAAYCRYHLSIEEDVPVMIAAITVNDFLAIVGAPASTTTSNAAQGGE